MSRLISLIILTAAAVATAVAPQPQPSAPKTYTLGSAPADFQPAIERANALIGTMQTVFLSELTAALRPDGPAGAIKACHIEATAVAQKIEREQGIAAGRTSDRLRNPTNTPRPWAEPIVKQYAGRDAAKIDGVAVDLGDHVGVMKPIAESAMCSGCHGPAERIDPRVRAVLKDRYPADRATGFRDGEIRGWFWVEVPKGK